MRVFRYIIVWLPILLIHTAGYGQGRVSGIVRDASNGERLIGATAVYQDRGVVTDNNGFFSISITQSDSITISFVGYSSLSLCVTGLTDTIVDINLVPGIGLGEFEVTAPRLQSSNVATLTTAELQSLPSLTGKPDVMRAMQMLPGIMGQSEGSSLLLVRGGNPGENMYLFDQVPIIYVNHLGGFMSVFNPDIINSLDLYKGAFPARYGGKLSSIVNITQREGNNNEFRGSYQLGITDLSLTLEGPITPKTTFIFTGRKTLFDIFLLAASSLSEGNDARVFYGFHDVNAKVSWKPDTRQSFHFNVFQGDDYLNSRSKKNKIFPNDKSNLTYIWGNWMLSGGWKYMASPRLFTENTIGYTHYRNKEMQKFSYAIQNEVISRDSWFLSSVGMLTAVSAWKYLATDNVEVNFGLNTSFASLLPAYANHTHITTPVSFSKSNTFENALYLENKISLPWKIELTAGVRGVHFYNDSYHDIKAEPRLGIQRNIAQNQQVNFSYMQVNQFSHLLFTPGSIFSNEVWIPAGGHILPSKSHQYTLGWTGSFANGTYLPEVNLYYKTMSDLAAYKEGFVNLRGDANWQSKIESGGKGEALGAEFMLRKTKGRITGFASYAWSRATRVFPEINQEQPFRFDFDRPHSISIAASYAFNKRSALNFSWVFQTGLPYTPVIGRQLTPSLIYDDDGRPFMYETFIYGDRNSGRMKNYHRLDFSYSINRFSRSNNLISTWSFGLYNAYNRKNPVYYYYNTDATGGIINPELGNVDYKPFALYQYALFPIIPTVSYKYYFNQGDKTDKPSFFQRLRNLLYHD